MYTTRPTISSVLLLILSTLTTAQQAADGALVPFTSSLPPCASQCGPLYDVQGGCTTQSCFCADARLTTLFTGGNAAVAAICGAASCTAPADQQRVADWYKSFCPSNAGTAPGTTAAGAPGATTTAAGNAPTNTGSGTSGGSNANNGNGNGVQGVVQHGSWFSTHWQWVVMLIVIIVAIVGGWVGACIWRRAYLRKKERQYELRPPAIPWAPAGPEQHMAGGLQRVYGPGVGMNANNGGGMKEMNSQVAGTGHRDGDVEKGGVWGKLRKGRS